MVGADGSDVAPIRPTSAARSKSVKTSNGSRSSKPVPANRTADPADLDEPVDAPRRPTWRELSFAPGDDVPVDESIRRPRASKRQILRKS